MQMHWAHWVVIALTVLSAGWMLLDGTRALIVGDYVTPSSGEYAGQLRPWSKLVQAVGIEPRSTLMKSIFVGYGLAALAMAVCFALKLPWAWWGMIGTAVFGLWFLPFGTVINIIVL